MNPALFGAASQVIPVMSKTAIAARRQPRFHAARFQVRASTSADETQAMKSRR